MPTQVDVPVAAPTEENIDASVGEQNAAEQTMVEEQPNNAAKQQLEAEVAEPTNASEQQLEADPAADGGNAESVFARPQQPEAESTELEVDRDERGMSTNLHSMDDLLAIHPDYPAGVEEHPISKPCKGDFFKGFKGKLPPTTVSKKLSQKLKSCLNSEGDEEDGTMVSLKAETPPHHAGRVIDLPHEDFRMMCDWEQTLTHLALD